MFNQALFRQLLIIDDEVVGMVEAPWVETMADVAAEADEAGSRRPEAQVASDRTVWAQAEAGNDRSPQSGGFG